MTDQDKPGFINGIQVMREVFGMTTLLSMKAIDEYWIVLKPFTQDQFTQACRRLMSKPRPEYGKLLFPLPGDFVDAVPKEYYKPFIPTPTEANETNGVAYDVLMPQLLRLMPAKGKIFNDQEAAAMVAKMDHSVEKEFSKIRT